jgi:hypothetical protein
LWNEFKVNSTLDIKDSDEHCLHLWFRHASFPGSQGCWLFPSQTLSFAFLIILKAPCFISSNNFRQNLMLIHCSKN